MFSAIKRFFTAPVYEGDPEKTLDASTTHRASVALLIFATISIPLVAIGEAQIRTFGFVSTSFSALVWLFNIFLVKREKRTIAKILILTLNTASIYYSIISTAGLEQPTIFALLFLLAAAHLFFPSRGAIVYGITLLLIATSIYGLQLTGAIDMTQPLVNSQGVYGTFIFTVIATSGILWIAGENYQANISGIRKGESELRKRNAELDQLRASLEKRVSERTAQLEKRATQFEAISNVADSIASLKTMEELLPAIAELVIERFGFYHTGIFLLDQNKEYAVLAASPTEAGRQMLANGHKLLVGEVGIVGRVASSGEPRITLDTGRDAVHFNNPLLPKTRSEMALPLMVENEVIGVLDVQSEQPQAFSDEDVAIMQVLANQLATAIQRTRLLQQVEQNLRELEKAYGRTTSDSWKSLSEGRLISNFGYRFDNTRIQPIQEVSTLAAEAITSGKILSNENGLISNHETAIPIKLRGQSIGVVTVKLREGHNATTIETIKQAVDRLAGSLESARLFEEARLRADREQAIAQVTSSISAANEYDTILRTTVEQIGKTLGQAEVSIQISTDSVEQTD